MKIYIDEYIKFPNEKYLNLQNSYSFNYLDQETFCHFLKNKYGDFYKYILSPNNKIIGYVLVENIKCLNTYIHICENWILISKYNKLNCTRTPCKLVYIGE